MYNVNGHKFDEQQSFTASEPDDRRTSNSSRTEDGSHQQGALALTHRLRHDKSILVLVLSEQHIFAGTQGGEILVFCLDTFERVATIEGHRGSVLGLCLSEDRSLLFSSAGDRLINVWDTKTYRRRYFLFSTYDVGDIFCVAYSSRLQTVYLGLQNTAIQWFNLGAKTAATGPSLKDHPLWRENHPFYDSPGPGGIRTPRPAEEDIRARDAKGGVALEIPKDNIHHFAHYGYVYCMLLAPDIFSGVPGQEILITGGGDGVINVWRVVAQAGGVPEKMFQLDDDREEGQSVLSMTLDGTFLYAGRSRGEVNVWDLETKQLVRSLKSHNDDVMSVCVGGGFLFSASVKGAVRVSSRIQAHEGKALTSAFTRHENKMFYVTGGNDNSIAVWNVGDCIAAQGAASKTSNEQMIESLKRFVSYRTVSSDPKYKGDCRRGASYLRSVFKSFGAATEMLPTDDANNPVILAKFRGNPATASNRKKVLFYGHYDVVAAENENGKWNHDPFTMEGVNGYLYGRGASDNKGPIIAAIFACADLMSQQALDADIVFLIEGEEESGSRGFVKTIRQHKKLIGDIDWILLANSYWLDDRMPCLTYGLRGVIHATVQVDSEHPDLHSGVDGSAKLDEPLKDLVVLLSTLAGRHGEVCLPGFYDSIPELTKEEGALYTDITQALLSRNPGLGDSDELAASLKRRWRDPSLTIHRFQTSGPDNATIIPRLAKAALSIRLVPNQQAGEVAQVLIDFLQSEFNKLESNNRLTVTIDHQAEPWLGDVTNEIFKCLERAIMDVWGPIIDPPLRQLSIPPANLPSETGDSYFANKHSPSPTTSNALASSSIMSPDRLHPSSTETLANSDLSAAGPPNAAASNIARHRTSLSRRKPLYIREGGSIPAIRFLELEFDAPAAHLPCGQASDSAHLDNERLRLINLYKSKDIFSRVFRELPCR
ncbi:glutathione degradosome [Myriangium duriaei CBS 260.36]|uniref:Glutathione degradosome n=1 Tax=Myriangium duriaei CBS 260.36 TaxID=1168546 RepID=A0A9P4JCH5_9PEZI|nr:glutathione degradosome [Myriangium duriaei CBS 260.36]